MSLPSTMYPSLMFCIDHIDCDCGICCCIVYHGDCHDSILCLHIQMDYGCYTVVHIVNDGCTHGYCGDGFVLGLSEFPLGYQSCVVRFLDLNMKACRHGVVVIVVVPVPGRRCLVCAHLLHV